MNIENLKTNLLTPKKELKDWLSEISQLDGKCCYVSKKSEFRAKLLLIIDIRESHGGKIKKIFDEKLWKNDGNIFEIKSDGLVELQDAISEAKYIDQVESSTKFDLKDEFLKFVVNQSTLIAILIACIIFSNFILAEHKNTFLLDIFLMISYFITLMIAMYAVDNGTKKIVLIFSIFVIIISFFAIYYFRNYLKTLEFIGIMDLTSLCLMIILNLSLVGSSFFSLMHSANTMIKNHRKVPRRVFLIIATMIYGIITIGFIQGLKTISFT